MRWPAARYRYRCGGAVPVLFVRDAGSAKPPSLPIKLVFLSPPALPAPRTGGAVAARTMEPQLPIAGTSPGIAVGTPAAGNSSSSVPSKTGSDGRVKGARRGRVPSITGQATGTSGAAVSPHGRMKPRGGGFHTAGSCPAGRGGGGVPRPFSRGAARACSRSQGAGPAGLLHPLACFTCKLLLGDWLAGQRWGIVPPAVPARAGRG